MYLAKGGLLSFRDQRDVRMYGLHLDKFPSHERKFPSVQLRAEHCVVDLLAILQLKGTRRQPLL